MCSWRGYFEIRFKSAFRPCSFSIRIIFLGMFILQISCPTHTSATKLDRGDLERMTLIEVCLQKHYIHLSDAMHIKLFDLCGSCGQVGPRFCLNPIKMFAGSFGGPTLYENPFYVSPNQVIPLSSSLWFCFIISLPYDIFVGSGIEHIALVGLEISIHQWICNISTLCTVSAV